MKKLLAAIFTLEKNDPSLQNIRLALATGSVQLVDAQGALLVFPASLQNALHYLVNILSRGQSVSIVPQINYLSCNEAAELLSCSRPHVYKLLDEKVIPCHYVGSHRRICFNDIIVYRDSLSQNRQQQAAEIAEITAKIKNQQRKNFSSSKTAGDGDLG
jgi:excisionase family DNA binding protein